VFVPSLQSKLAIINPYLLGGLPTKRSNEAAVAERPPEPKKPRLQSAEEESKAVPQPPIPNPPQNPPTQPAPPAVPQPTTDPSNLIGGRFTAEQVMGRIQFTTEYLQKLDAQLKEARAEGKIELAEKLQLEFNQKKEMQIRFMQAIRFHARKQPQQQASGQADPSQPQGLIALVIYSDSFLSFSRILFSYSSARGWGNYDPQ